MFSFSEVNKTWRNTTANAESSRQVSQVILSPSRLGLRGPLADPSELGQPVTRLSAPERSSRTWVLWSVHAAPDVPSPANKHRLSEEESARA